MQKFIDYINASLPDERGNDILYRFKKRKLDEMNEQFGIVMQRGISNTEVLTDLVISENPRLSDEFDAYRKKELAKRRAKRNTILNIAGSITYLFTIIISFLAIGFTSHIWSPTWLIVADGILIWVAYLLSLGVNRITRLKRFFHIFARILMAIDVIVVAVAVFLFCTSYLHLNNSWLVLIFGIAAMFVADAIYAIVTRQKMAIINVLVYLPVVATMMYIILSAFGILVWNTGWLLIIASLILDFIIIFAKLTINQKSKQEVIDTWQEN